MSYTPPPPPPPPPSPATRATPARRGRTRSLPDDHLQHSQQQNQNQKQNRRRQLTRRALKRDKARSLDALEEDEHEDHELANAFLKMRKELRAMRARAATVARGFAQLRTQVNLLRRHVFSVPRNRTLARERKVQRFMSQLRKFVTVSTAVAHGTRHGGGTPAKELLRATRHMVDEARAMEVEARRLDKCMDRALRCDGGDGGDWSCSWG